MDKICGKVEVRDSVLYLNDGSRSIPFYVWCVSHGIKLGDKIKITLDRIKEDGK